MAHRLAWLYMTGQWPKDGIDHIDGDGLNNRWSNLRAANQSENGANRRRNSNNASGFKGVRHHVTGRFQARIRYRGKEKSLGYFDTPEEAHAAYLAAAEMHFGEFARAA